MLQPDRRARLLQSGELRSPVSATLYHNNGDGTFTDVSARSGMLTAVGNGLGVVAGDFDGDGRIDLLVANDRTPNHLWLNQGDGRFREAALTMGCALDQDGVAKSGMGVDAVDADDGRRSRSARGEPRRRVGLVLSESGKVFRRRHRDGRGCARRAAGSRGSAWRSAISITMDTSTCTKPTPAWAGSRSSIPRIRTRSRACCFEVSPDRGSRK